VSGVELGDAAAPGIEWFEFARAAGGMTLGGPHMELLRRSLLLGSVLPGLWLFHLTFLDPVVTISPANDAAGHQVLSGSGPAWDALMQDLDGLSNGKVPRRVSGRMTSATQGAGGTGFNLFLLASDEPIGRTLWRLAAATPDAYLSASPSGGAPHYRLDLHTWNRNHFRPGDGFIGQPRPPDSLLYPARLIGMALLLIGTLLYVVLPNPVRSTRTLSGSEALCLAGVIALFAAPMVAVGGSVQALTMAPWLTIPCWILAAGCMHLFARPVDHLKLQLLGAPGDAAGARADPLRNPGFVRVGVAFLAVAVGPAAAVVMASLALWNR
jgi:hypothetical protein